MELRSESPSPARCPDEDLLRGQMLADCRWSDVAANIVWSSPRHAGTRKSLDPYHWMILQSARQCMVPSNSLLFDLSPGESSEYFDNHFSQCCKCDRCWWLVDTPVLGLRPVCEIEVVKESLDVKATLSATPHSPFVLFRVRDEALNPPMDVDTSGAEAPDFGDASGVDLDEDADVQELLPTSAADIWKGFTTMVNPNFCPKRSRQWIDLLALDFLRTHQRRPDDPSVIYRIDETEANRDGRFIFESSDVSMNVDAGAVDDDNVMIDDRYDSSVAVHAMLSSFEPRTTPLMQGEEGKGLSRLGDLTGIEHVIVVGPFCSGTNAM